MKIRQCHETIYMETKFFVETNGEVSDLFSVGRGVLEGDVTSSIYFNVMCFFRQADELRVCKIFKNLKKLRTFSFSFQKSYSLLMYFFCLCIIIFFK